MFPFGVLAPPGNGWTVGEISRGKKSVNDLGVWYLTEGQGASPWEKAEKNLIILLFS